MMPSKASAMSVLWRWLCGQVTRSLNALYAKAYNFEELKFSSVEILYVGKVERRPASPVSSDTVSQSVVEAKKDSTLFESLDDDIVLDTNTLQSIATDLSQGGQAVDKSVIGEDMARKLAEIENTKDKEGARNAAEMQQMFEEPVVVTEVARKVVDALTSNNVLGKVLTPEEADILNRYFRRKIPLNEQVLETLDTALDKILRRAPEFYGNKEELDVFLKDPANAKAQLLDALIAKKSDFLVDLMGDASFYANMISQGIVDVYQLATKGVLVVRDNLDAAQAAVLQGCEYSKRMASMGVTLTFDAARKGSELVTSGVNTTLSAASASADMLTKSATYAANTSMAAIGQSMQVSKDAAAKGTELAYNAAAMGARFVNYFSRRFSEVSVMRNGSELVSSGVNTTLSAASASADMLTKSATYVADTSMAAIGQSMQVSRDAAAKGTELAYNAAAMGVSGTMAVASTSVNLLTRTTSGVSLAAVNTGQAVNQVVGQGVGYSKDLASKGAQLTYDAAATVRSFRDRTAYFAGEKWPSRFSNRKRSKRVERMKYAESPI
ncbi:unnamed protein product [Toxocara canis]|uniref:Senescence domain-containing protein n=1 Tax=Toxocara canis TaxID=6265 RepID=A0A183TWG6_TOXCA|nr:unnamed protein product [Toxocara canis]